MMGSLLFLVAMSIAFPAHTFANLVGNAADIPFHPSWEKYPENRPWTEYLYTLIEQALFQELDQASDMCRFCARYRLLPKEQKIFTWIELFSQVSYYESAWDPTSRMQEDMGTDPVTGRPVFSEGLLQLSYQDILNYPKILKYPLCKIDWNKDRSLASKDPSKTILDPLINLECGTRIMADQVARTKKIVLQSGVYWATLREWGRYSVVSQIQNNIKSLSYCKK